MSYNISVKEFLEQVKSGNINMDDFFAKTNEEVERVNKKTNSFITTVQAKKPKTKSGKLFGLPVSIKDNICTKNIRTTAGSKILESYTPVFDATVTKKILDEGSTIVGKTAMDEFGFGTFSVNCAYKIPKNPWDLERSCGGSSGGSGAVVAATKIPNISIAESTGGSISCPASFTGTVGLTPTYGRVSRYGLVDYANSLDKIGVMAKRVWDAALGLSVIAGKDERDQTTVDKPNEDYTTFCNKDVRGMTIGVPQEYFGQGVNEKVANIVWDAISVLESLGCKYKEVSLPMTKYALYSYYIIAWSESSTNLAKYCGVRYGLQKNLEGNFNEYFSSVRADGFGEEAKRRILLGTYARMAGYRDQYYLKAMKVRRLVIEDFKKAFKKFDVLAAPTMPMVAPEFAEIKKLTPLQHYMSDILTVPANLAGIPHISVPCGFFLTMPVGLHLMGNHFDEGKIVQLAAAFERETKFTDRWAEV